jgi:uncharacterized phage infection (PIP) family protein YhgE
MIENTSGLEAQALAQLRHRLEAFSDGIKRVLKEMNEKREQSRTATTWDRDTMLGKIHQEISSADIKAEKVDMVLAEWVRTIDPKVQLFLSTNKEDGTEKDTTLVLTY